MRTATVVVLSLLAALAAAAVVPHREADKDLLQKQYKLLRLLYRVQQYNFLPEEKAIAESYNLEENFDHYKDPQYVKIFLKFYNNGYFKQRGESFSPYYQRDQYDSKALFDLFYYAKDFDTFYKTAVWAKDHVNEAQFVYAFTLAVLHREDTRDVVLPAPYEIFPQLFVNAHVIQKAYDARLRGIPGTKESPYYILSNYSGYPVAYNPEELVSYFTEDVGLNSFFAYAHYMYPYWFEEAKYDVQLFQKRGEAFLYILQQLLARYHLERLSNHLPDVQPVDYERPVKVGYYPELRLQNGIEAPARPEGVFPRDIDFLFVEEAKNFERRIYDAIDYGYVYAENQTKYNIREHDFTDLIGSIIEGNYGSVNRYYYGSLFRNLLSLFGHIVDPVHSYGVSPSVLEQPETFLRDPLFYRIAKRIVSIYYRYKNQLTRYTYQDFEFKGVEINSVSVDKLVTYFDYFDFDLSNAFTISGPEAVKEIEDGSQYKYVARQYRLNHKPFSYHVKVTSDKEVDSVVRVFFGPRYDVNGREYTFDEQRQYYVLLDIFTYKLKSGENVIERNSKDIEYYGSEAPSFFDLFRDTQAAAKGEQKYFVDEYKQHFGFPQRLALPRGTRNGLPLNFFVLVTPAREGYTHPLLPYSDGHAPGYPFDRRSFDFDLQVPNAYFGDAVVVHRRQEEVATPVA
uniref:Hexamerin-like protein 2 n=1 Tax=Prosarthria teretrirostris TaxID=58589 RepID=A0A2I6SDA4_9ORTH|nr:hexamerin-like protein 2 [Prosarthria teretrirostris]